MIKLVFEGMCKDCQCAQLELVEYDTCLGTEWTVCCVHVNACDRMEDMTIERMGGEQE